MKFTLFIFLSFISLTVFSQVKSSVTEVVNGKKYYVHVVERGSTLYGIKNIYGVSMQEIFDANPGAEEGVKSGQKLLIPVKDDNQTSSPNPSGNMTASHTVKDQETLYGIARMYSISVQSLMDANPGSDQGIQVGQILKIPGANTNIQTNGPVNTAKVPVQSTRPITKDTIISHTVLDHETLYSISKRYMADMDEIKRLNNLSTLNIRPGQVLKVPVKAENFAEVGIRSVSNVSARKIDSLLIFKKKEHYKIGVFLPLNLDRGPGYSEAITNYALEFWMGAQLAIDSLTQLGLKADVYLHDSKNDSMTIRNILNTSEAQDYDLIIGPLYPNHAGFVSQWCMEHQIRMICPVNIETSILENNPYVYAMVPSDITLIEGQADYIVKNYNTHAIILVKPLNESEMPVYEAFRKRYYDSAFKGNKPVLIEATMDNFTTFIRKGGKTAIIMPTSERATALKFMNALNKAAFRMGDDRITVFGTKEWMSFDDIQAQYRNKYSFHFASPYDFNYNYDYTKHILRKFRRKFNYDFTKMAAQGFDVFLYSGLKLLLEKDCKKGVMNQIQITQTGVGSGFENSKCFMIYQDDYELYNAEIPRVEE